MFTLFFVISFAFFTLCILPESAMAYIGPGAGLSAFGTVIAVIVAACLAIAGFVWYPVKRYMAKRKKQKEE